jgi:hypothetical protein
MASAYSRRASMGSMASVGTVAAKTRDFDENADSGAASLHPGAAAEPLDKLGALSLPKWRRNYVTGS